MHSPAGSSSQTPCGSAAVYCAGNVQTTVPLGSYSTPEAVSATIRTGAAVCPPGYYCANGVRTACPPGVYGSTSGLTSAGCSGPCSGGYYCPGTNNTSPTAVACGGAAFFCPPGASSPTAVGVGNYSVAGAAQAPCEPGSYCVAGVKTLCAGGTYSATAAATVPCTLVCTAGYYCPAGSTSGVATPCGNVNVYWCVGVAGSVWRRVHVECLSTDRHSSRGECLRACVRVCFCWSSLRCDRSPAGSAAPVSVGTGNYSTPLANAESIRTGSSRCPAGSYCVNGYINPCPAGFYGATVGSTSLVGFQHGVCALSRVYLDVCEEWGLIGCVLM